MDNEEATTEGPTTEEAPVTNREFMQTHAGLLAELLTRIAPSRESSLATTKLDEFYFWASAAMTVEEARHAAAQEAGE